IFANLSYSSKDQVTVHFINRDGEQLTTTAKEGESLLEVVVNHNLAIDGFGSVGGKFLPLVWEQRRLTSCFLLRSRLGCQVCVKKWMDGLTVRVPMDVSDMRKQLEVEKQSKQ
ncbi:ADX protein, partial [Illadopsis cleaveri]|nr:ADX protein [Illadopsis cleaveri]